MSERDEVNGYTRDDLKETALEQAHTYDSEDWDCLEIVYVKRNDVLSTVELLLAFGGPDIRLTIGDSEWATIELNWWGKSMVEEVYAVEFPSMFAWFEEIGAC